MSLSEQNSIITTVSGVFGGVGKAITSLQILTSITLQGISEVALYAAVSAIVGYGVKVLIDVIKKQIRK